MTCSISSLGRSSTRTQSSDQTWPRGCFGLGVRPIPERKSEEIWNAKCDKNRFILSTGSFPDLLDPGAIYGIEVRSQECILVFWRAFPRSIPRSILRSIPRSLQGSFCRTISRTFQGSFSGTISIVGGSSSKNVLYRVLI